MKFHPLLKKSVQVSNYIYFIVLRNDIATVSKNYNRNIIEETYSNLCGSIIITRYNNRTYRIDDIDFNLKPTSTFDQNGVTVSFLVQ